MPFWPGHLPGPPPSAVQIDLQPAELVTQIVDLGDGPFRRFPAKSSPNVAAVVEDLVFQKSHSGDRRGLFRLASEPAFGLGLITAMLDAWKSVLVIDLSFANV